MVGFRRSVERLWAHREMAIAFALLFTFFRMARLEGWDDGFYLSELTSAVGDRDLLLQDDLLRIENPLPLRLRALTVILDSGALQNTFSVGPPALHAAYAWPLLGGRAAGGVAALAGRRPSPSGDGDGPRRGLPRHHALAGRGPGRGSGTGPRDRPA